MKHDSFPLHSTVLIPLFTTSLSPSGGGRWGCVRLMSFPLMNWMHVWAVSGTYRLWVGQWTQPVVVLLTSCIPEAQIDRLAVHHHVSRVVVKSVGSKKRSERSERSVSCWGRQCVSFKRVIYEWYINIVSLMQSLMTRNRYKYCSTTNQYLCIPEYTSDGVLILSPVFWAR